MARCRSRPKRHAGDAAEVADAVTFLASPLTVAATALTGRVTDPRDALTDAAIRMIDRSQAQDKPFFLMLHQKAPHRTWEPDERNKALFKDKAILCTGAISPRTFGADPGLKPYAYDPVKARQLLTEAGYPNGFETRLAFGTYMPQVQEQAEAIAADIAKVGIKVKLEPFERAVQWRSALARDHALEQRGRQRRACRESIQQLNHFRVSRGRAVVTLFGDGQQFRRCGGLAL